ncbi:uncharacterized protein LOC120420274 [Culex pipiens pallens]|uniref:uncharacterized protein LOC120420274 n=1 Tax=Culex pipiens pallens TaxID=42434 RepID=UPI0019541B45|nr:uncharacterized protein LOC120420274 [Culex pipiens pallens]XP_039439209.1 uncharacterized protein LOC120420274 [Culex pipiens pallens]
MKFCATILLAIALIIPNSLADEPISKEQKVKIAHTCFKLLRTSAEVRERFSRMQLGDDDGQDMTCMIRCGGIVSGMYDDEAGWNLDMAVRQAQGKTGVEQYREAFGRCAGEVQPEQYGEDYCRKSYLQFRCGMRAWKNHIKD